MPSEDTLNTSDAELLRRTAAGDPTAFDHFVSRHEGAVMRYLRSLTRDASRIEDAFQEAFVAAWRAAGTFRGEDSARAWMLTIARNAMHRQHRMRAGEPRETVSIEHLGRDAGWGSPDAGDAFARRIEDRDLLQKALARLSPEEREVLILRDVEGLPGKDVARVTGLGLAAMKSRLHRARLRLAAAVREEYHAGS